MARRAKSGLKVGQLIVGLIILGGLVAAGWFVLDQGGEAYATTPLLDVTEFRERAASMEGNTYKFTGTVQAQLERSESAGRLLHVSVKNDDGSFGEPVGVQLPAELDTQNIQKGQDFVFVVEVAGKLMLVVRDIRKI